MTEYDLGRGRIQVADYETNEILLEATCISATVNIPEALLEDEMSITQLEEVVQDLAIGTSLFLDNSRNTVVDDNGQVTEWIDQSSNNRTLTREAFLDRLTRLPETYVRPQTTCSSCGAENIHLFYLGRNRGICISCAMQQQASFRTSVVMAEKAIELFGIKEKKRFECTTRYIRFDESKKKKRRKKKTLPRWR